MTAPAGWWRRRWRPLRTRLGQTVVLTCLGVTYLALLKNYFAPKVVLSEGFERVPFAGGDRVGENVLIEGGVDRSDYKNRCGGPSHSLSIIHDADGREYISQNKLYCQLLNQSAPAKRTHVMFIGHSRLRMLFEHLSDQLALRYLTRAEAAGLSAVPFTDKPLQSAWLIFAFNSSTCLEVLPKPRKLPVSAWCSLMTVSEKRSLTLEFRWRYALQDFLPIVSRLRSACEDRNHCLDVLYLAQGLHFLVNGGFGTSGSLYALMLHNIKHHLQYLASRGTRVVWMLEHASNSWNQHGSDAMNDDITVQHAIVQDVLGDLRSGGNHKKAESPSTGIWIWSSHLRTVANFLSSTCLSKNYTAADDERTCLEEVYHVSKNSIAKMAGQLWRFTCACLLQTGACCRTLSV